MATIYYGTDISRYQSFVGSVYTPIDWVAYAAAKSFVIIKAGGGDANGPYNPPGLYADSQFSTNRTGARAQAGLKIGYYFYGDRRIDAASSANYFISILGSLNNYEILALDIEGIQYPEDDWAFTFVTAVYNAFGFYPFVYMSQFSPTSTTLAWGITNAYSPLWMANYGLASTDFSRTTGNADAIWGQEPAPNYHILQYSSSGSVAGISHVPVDLDTFYSPNNTLADWNTFGYGGGVNPPGPPPPPPPSPTVPGTLTVASVSGPAISYTQPAKQTVNLPTESYDQVLFSTTYNTSVTSSSWPVTVNYPNTGLSQYAYPIGNYRYSINGDSNLNDYGFINAGDYGQFPGTLPTVVVQPIVSSSGGLSFIVTVNNLSGSVTVSLSLNIALLAYPNTTNVPLATVQQQVARSNAIAKIALSAYSTYRRIYSDSSVGTSTTTVAHKQNTIPNILYWGQDTTGTIEPQPVTWGSGGHTTALGISMDATNIYFYVDAANTKCWFRIFKDN